MVIYLFSKYKPFMEIISGFGILEYYEIINRCSINNSLYLTLWLFEEFFPVFSH